MRHGFLCTCSCDGFDPALSALSDVAQMRRQRKGRAHALVMGGDATPTSGAVTVRIYCAAAQQRLQVGSLQRTVSHALTSDCQSLSKVAGRV